MTCNNCLQEILQGESFFEDEDNGTAYHADCRQAAVDRRNRAEDERAAALARAEAAEAEAARMQYELDRQLYRADVLAARVAELEATLGRLDALAPDYELPDGAAVAEAIASGYILTAGCRDIHGKVAGVAAVERNNEMLRARVAELEAQLAAQQWRPVTNEWPPQEESTPVRMRNGVIRWGYRHGDRWHLTGGQYSRESVTHAYALPPAPAAAEATE